MFKFHPILKSVLWGGNRIAAYKGIVTEQTQIGESWEISGVKGWESVVAAGSDAGLTLPELIAKYHGKLVGDATYARFGNEFPLLVKIIDAEQDLSLQVHPDDALAQQRHGSQGKTEMWYIIDADPLARILAGFNEAMEPCDLERMARDGSIMQVMRVFDSHKGDAFFLPPGTIHSIGAGNLLAEIQQTSDITYRIYDHNRRDAQGNLRQLHVEQAADAIDYDTTRICKVPQGQHPLVHCDKFVAETMTVDSERHLDLDALDSFLVMICIEGEVEVQCDHDVNCQPDRATLQRGETILLPACAGHVTIAGKATILAAWMPNCTK